VSASFLSVIGFGEAANSAVAENKIIKSNKSDLFIIIVVFLFKVVFFFLCSQPFYKFTFVNAQNALRYLHKKFSHYPER